MLLLLYTVCMYVSSFLSFNLEYKYTTANLPFFSFGGTVNLILYSLFLNNNNNNNNNSNESGTRMLYYYEENLVTYLQ